MANKGQGQPGRQQGDSDQHKKGQQHHGGQGQNRDQKP